MRPAIPGVPSAGHFSNAGYWHPGFDGDCPKCVFVCPTCGRRSYNPMDIRERYCGVCHQWAVRSR